MYISNAAISNKLTEIFKELNNTDYIVNPFFRISKATPEQMRRYRYISSKSPIIIVFIHLFISIPINIIKIFTYSFLSIIFSNQYKVYSSNSHKSEILFLSHAIGENITNIYGDQFFALMPENLQKEHKKVSIIYTNHALFGYYKNNDLLQAKHTPIDRYLIPKFLKPQENINYLKLIIPGSIKCLFYGLKKLLRDPIKSTLLIESSLFFYSRSTYSNFLLGQRANDFCMKNNIETLVMTFEGHSYEQYVIEKINKSKLKLSIIMYQHSPIVADHFGIESFLKINNCDLSILTTGILYDRMFKNLSHKPKYYILGSNKSTSNFIEEDNTSSTQILFAPEGTASATINFLKLINYLCNSEAKLSFSIRLHPNLKKNLFVHLFIRKLNLKYNFFLSDRSLSDDLKKSKLVFYRSSAVGVEALMSSAVPIFYGDSTQLGLNVLGEYSEFIPAITNHIDVLNFIRTANTNISKELRSSISNEIFTKIDYKKLISILKN